MAAITLRNALRIKKQIEAKVKSSGNSVSQVTIDIDDRGARHDIAAYLAGKETKILENVEKQARLASILADLRLKVETANVNSGITAVLSKIGEIDNHLTAFKPLSVGEAAKIDIVEGRIDRKRETAKAPAPQNIYGRQQEDTPTIQVHALSEATIAAYKKKMGDLRRERQTLDDKRLHLNGSTEIQIGDDDVGFLAELEIL